MMMNDIISKPIKPRTSDYCNNKLSRRYTDKKKIIIIASARKIRKETFK